MYYCALKSPLSYNDGSSVIYLQWIVSSQLRGDEGDIPLSISLVVSNQEEGLMNDDGDTVSLSLLPIAIANHSVFL